MSTELKLQEDLIKAMKSGDKVVVSTIRLIKSAIGYAKIEKGTELTDEDVMQVIAREGKKRRESIESAKSADRSDIADSESAELEVITRYLPEQMDEAQVEAIVREVIAETGATSAKDQGRVMGAAMKKLRGKADGTLVSAITQRVLAG
jgi:uncharacterized protein YqeY